MITNLTDKQSYQGNGSNTNFAIPFTIVVSDQAEVGVILRDVTVPTAPVDTPQVFGAGQNYTLSGANPPTSVFNTTVVMAVAPTANQIVVIYRKMPLTQLLNMLTNNFDYSNLNVVHDRIVAMLQVLNEVINRAPQLAQATQKTQPLVIPEPIGGYLLGFDPTGSFLQLFATAGSAGVAAINALTGALTLAAGQNMVLGTSGNVITLGAFSAYNAQSGASYNIALTDDYIGATGSLTIAQNFILPLAATAKSGFMCVVKDQVGGAATNNITITASGSDLIDGQATQVMTQNFDSVTLFCTGTGWALI